MVSPFLGSSIRIHTSSIGLKELLVAGWCALVLLVVLLFDSCLSSSGLICCYAVSSSFVDFVFYLSALWLLAYGVVNFCSVFSPPVALVVLGSCGFSTTIWLRTFAMGSPLWGRGCFSRRSERRFGLNPI